MSTDPFEALLDQMPIDELLRQRQRYLDQADELRARAAAIDTLLSLKDRVSSFAVPGESDAERLTDLVRGVDRPSGLGDAILRTMADNDGGVWTADAILFHMEGRGWAPKGKTPRNTVAATLSRLVADGKVDRVGRGEYQLPAEAGKPPVSDATEREEQLRVGEGG